MFGVAERETESNVWCKAEREIAMFGVRQREREQCLV